MDDTKLDELLTLAKGRVRDINHAAGVLTDLCDAQAALGGDGSTLRVGDNGLGDDRKSHALPDEIKPAVAIALADCIERARWRLNDALAGRPEVGGVR